MIRRDCLLNRLADLGFTHQKSLRNVVMLTNPKTNDVVMVTRHELLEEEYVREILHNRMDDDAIERFVNEYRAPTYH